MKLTQIFIASALILGGIEAQAQTNIDGKHFYGIDAFKYSQSKISGSARMQGMGGNYTSLGADAGNASTNPAGLGFYNRSELSITPIFNSLKTSTIYPVGIKPNTNQIIQIPSNSRTLNPNIGQLGLMLSSDGKGTRKKRSTFAVTYSKQINLVSDFNYDGENDKSSMADYFVEQANGINYEVLENKDEFTPGPPASAYSNEGMAYWTNLIDPTIIGDQRKGKNNVYEKVEKSLPVTQTGRNYSLGSLSQWTLGYGVNFNDKTYFGFSLGYVIMNQESFGNHNETFSDSTNKKFNGFSKKFNGFKFNEELFSIGRGVNLSVGTIIKVSDNISLGASLTTPTRLKVDEAYNSSITTDAKSFKPDFPTVKTDENIFNYIVTTPLKISGGATIFLPNKKGFITTDAEYVGYAGMNLRFAMYENGNITGYEKSAVQNSKIKNFYKDAVNLKAGAEYRIDNIRLRLGAKYMPDPFKQKIDNLDRSQMIFSGGVGYRSAKFFVDLAGVFNTFKTAFTPYELANTANYASANITNNQKSFVISVGTFF